MDQGVILIVTIHRTIYFSYICRWKFMEIVVLGFLNSKNLIILNLIIFSNCHLIYSMSLESIKLPSLLYSTPG